MRLVITTDNHVFYDNQQHHSILKMMNQIREIQPDVICNAGDFGEVLMEGANGIEELFSETPTLWVAGNHDLYTRQRLIPPEAMDRLLQVVSYGIPLQKSWNDQVTFYEKDGVLFLGTIGFPDFASPKLQLPPTYYDRRCPTVDGQFMNLGNGWLQYSTTLIDAFEKKLEIINENKCKNIVILTHYPCYESQYKFNPAEDISAYFYCYRLGLIISETAKKHPKKNFYAIAGHGHSFNLGKWVQEMPNLTTHGIVTDYNQQRYITLEITYVRD